MALVTCQLWVNDERTHFVRLWENGTVETAWREAPDHTWGPPVYLKPELPANGLRVLTKQQVDTVYGVLRVLLDALGDAGKTIHTTRGSASATWTATDEFIQAFLTAVRILRGVDSPEHELLAPRY